MSTKAKWLNFPLSALAYGTGERERLETLAMWCIIDVGTKAMEHWRRQIHAPSHVAVLNHFCRAAHKKRIDEVDPAWQAWARLDKLAEAHAIKHDDVNGYVWALGCETLAFNPQWRGAADCLAGHKRLSEFFTQVRNATGRAHRELCYVNKFKWDWWSAALRDVWDNNGSWPGEMLSYSHFAVLCAVLSKIGGNDPSAKSCGWQEIQRRALGYVTADEMRLAMTFRQDGAQPLSRDQIDRRTHQLALANFFLKHVPKIGRKALPAWYGTGLDRAKFVQLAEAAKLKTRGGWMARRRQQQAEQTALHNNVIAFESGRFATGNGRSDGRQQPRTGGERTA